MTETIPSTETRVILPVGNLCFLLLSGEGVATLPILDRGQDEELGAYTQRFIKEHSLRPREYRTINSFAISSKAPTNTESIVVINNVDSRDCAVSLIQKDFAQIMSNGSVSDVAKGAILSYQKFRRAITK